MSDILDLRYTEKIREEKGGTYGVGVYVRFTHYPKSRYQLIVTFDCDPEEVEELSQIVTQEIKKIQKNGPTEKDLHKVQENKLKKRKEDLKENRFWINALRNHYYHNGDVSDVIDYEKYVNDLSIESIKEISSFLENDYVKVVLMPKK